jgi:hypothetical protein
MTHQKRDPMPRPTMQEIRDRRVAKARAEVAETIAEGRMTVRQMTREERIVSDARRDAIRARRAAGLR